MGICSPELRGRLPLGVIPRNTSVARRSEKICRRLQSPLAGAHNDEGLTGACPEGLLPGGDPTVRGEDASSWRLPEGPLWDEPNKLGRPHSGRGPGHEGSTSQLGHGGLPRLNGLAPAARGHHRDGLLQDLLPTHPLMPLPG